jgi:proteasome lid subunit RPN8/RPN11
MDILRKNKRIKLRQKWKIKRKCLDLILESAKSTFPNEFAAFLRVDKEKKDTIIELIILPGTISGDSHAIFRLHMLPIDFSIVGTIHSHPSPSYRPSEADLQFFRKTGKVHIIVADPFGYDSWKAFDQIGNEINIEII